MDTRPWHAVGLATAAVLLLAACSSHAPNTQPTVNFGSGVSVTPGMPGMTAMPSTTTGPADSSPPSSPSSPTGTAAPVAGNAVTIDNFKFDPASVTVPVGSTVTWTNKDEEPHTIAAKDGSFHSPSLDTKGTYSFTFTKPGSYDYICSIHPFMTGTVVVTA